MGIGMQRESYLKVEVKGCHHVYIVRKALQGLKSVRILNDSENLITEQALEVTIIQHKIPKKTHLFLFEVITNCIIPITSFPLWLETARTTDIRKLHSMWHMTVRSCFLKHRTHVALLKLTYSVPAILFKNSITWYNIIFTHWSVRRPNKLVEFKKNKK